nr:HAD-IB family phosphatase [Pacificimonas pallii]
MDRTITRTGTYSAWLRHWTQARAKWRYMLLPLSALAGAGYILRLVSRSRLKEINHRLLMGGRTNADAAASEARAFARGLVPAGCFEEAIARVKAEQAEGRRVILATASYAFYAREIAALVGIAEVVGTRVVREQNGDIRAKIRGRNCYDAEKLAMVEQYLADDGIDRADIHVRMFSDHHSDAPIMDWADEAFAVNGDRKMARMARARGWRHLHWR